MTPTNRIFEDIETNSRYRLHVDNDTHAFKLFSEKPLKLDDPGEGKEVNGFYICAHTGVTIKLNTGKSIALNPLQFYKLKEGEEVTHKKYIGFTKFTKV